VPKQRYQTCREYNEAMDRISDKMDETERTEALEQQWEDLLQERNRLVSAGRIEWERPIMRED